ncbi:MAG: 30S ribosomal protein S19e [Thermoplasmata archaeon]|nr:30S ribosomal protein S19e [Thermoplasmata archaeon]
MTTAYDVPPEELIKKLTEKIKADGSFTPPEWAKYAKTGTHAERSPVQDDWWYTRVASVMRKIYLLGPIGTERLSAEYGGLRRRGSAPAHPRKGSRNIVRKILQQLEQAGYVVRTKRGRVITPEGRKVIDNLSHTILLELSAKNENLKKYL